MPGVAPISPTMRRLARCHDLRLSGPQAPRDPFRTLVGCLLSLRTKDEVSVPASERLFARARSPGQMLDLPARTIARIIYPAGFYRRKAEQIRAICRLLIDRHAGRVPADIDALVALPGVGRKTANLVRTLGFALPGICVDIHVHRIAGRLGWVATRHPDETETRLREILPRRYWIPINKVLVTHGQRICRPVSPVCSTCPVEADCPQRGVGRHR